MKKDPNRKKSASGTSFYQQKSNKFGLLRKFLDLKSLKSIERTQRLVAKIGVKCRNFYLVPNYRFSQNAEKFVQNADGTYLEKIEPDDKMEEYKLQGRSLLQLLVSSLLATFAGNHLARSVQQLDTVLLPSCLPLNMFERLGNGARITSP